MYKSLGQQLFTYSLRVGRQVRVYLKYVVPQGKINHSSIHLCNESQIKYGIQCFIRGNNNQKQKMPGYMAIHNFWGTAI